MFNRPYKILIYLFLVAGVGQLFLGDINKECHEYTPRMYIPSKVTQGVKVILAKASRHMYQAAVIQEEVDYLFMTWAKAAI